MTYPCVNCYKTIHSDNQSLKCEYGHAGKCFQAQLDTWFKKPIALNEDHAKTVSVDKSADTDTG